MFSVFVIELWKPQLLLPEQLFPEYLKLNVTFNIAPPDYRFSEYVISVLELDMPKPMYTEVAETVSEIPDVSDSHYTWNIHLFTIRAF